MKYKILNPEYEFGVSQKTLDMRAWRAKNHDKWLEYIRKYNKKNKKRIYINTIKGLLKELGITFEEALFLTGLDIQKKVIDKK